MTAHPDPHLARGKKIRLVVTLVLSVSLMLWFSGCIYIPLFGKVKNPAGVAPSQQLGPANSRKPLRETFATRAQVTAVFGAPDLISANGHAIGYTRLSAPNCLYIGICNGVERRDYYLFLDFDDHNILRRYALVRGSDEQDDFGTPVTYAYQYQGLDLPPEWTEFLRQNPHPTAAPATRP